MTETVLAPERADEEAPAVWRRLLATSAPEGLDAFDMARRLAGGELRVALHVASDANALARFEAAAQFVAPKLEILRLPAWDCLPYDRVSPSHVVMSERLATLAILASTKARAPRLVLTTANAVLQRVPSPKTIVAGRFRAKKNERVDRDALVAHLEGHGYRRTGTVVDPGEYAVRGGLLDLFPTGAAQPLRLDFFGASLDAIRSFDPATQRSLGHLNQLELLPVSEVMLDPAAIERFRIGYLQQFGAVSHDPLLESIEAGRNFPGMEHWLPLFHDRLVSIAAFFPVDAEISLDHHAREAIAARALLIADHYKARREPVAQSQSFGSAPYRALPPELLYLDESGFERALGPRRQRHYSLFTAPPAVPSGFDGVVDLGGHPGRDFAPERADRQANLFDAIALYLRELTTKGERPIIACHSDGARDRFRQILEDHGLESLGIATSLSDALDGAAVTLATLPVDHGFSAPGLCVVGEENLLGDRLQRGSKRPRRNAKFIADLGVLSEGNLVVHGEHGIGRFEGLVTLEIGGAPHDCLRLVYAGNDKLFVPVENLDVLTRYGHDDKDGEGQLDKLGGVGWQSRKAKVKQRIREMAEGLLKIAAQRALRKGVPISLPPGIYDEFVARFPFEETEDQLGAIEAVLEDLASGRPMDRLICGDVGYGKTEVALRAAFVVAMSGKQVALLAPTTLLVRQHFRVFSERFAGMPIRVEQLSRFVPAAKAKEVKEALAKGEVDIVVGTHALLAESIQFRDLGLVTIDEEQHFGVIHKERMKQLRAEVHVLTMTATPIPRTLQMALGGMREMSIIATPPVDRLAVRTYVMPADPVVLREAVMREHYRGGQSFVVCPRIADQPKLAEDLKKLVPEVRIGIANGRMAPKALEDVMGAFYDRQLDILLATNIIESGLDIPTANTLIVHRADLFGLSQLYQLRGRVGRSKLRGYAYFTLPTDKHLRETAERRLQVIQSLDGLGAGFQLASHDLDIRGAGNLLGDEQSGHIKEVGFELYNHMLNEAIAEIREAERGAAAEAARTDWAPQITVDAAALMPETYIGDLDLRLAMYRRLASLEDPADIDAFAAELVDRFGPMPPETEQLLKLVALKQLCRKANVAKLDVGPKGVVVGFHENRFARPERLVGFIAESRGQIKVRPDHRVVMLRETTSPPERLKVALGLMQNLVRLAA